jgi:amino acid adenylation domain-containing protein
MSKVLHDGIVDRVREYGRTQSDRVAVIAGDTRLTYAELSEQIRFTSQRLAGHGVRPGDLVGITMPRSIETLIAILSCYALGAAFVPLDSNLPANRLHLMLTTAQPSLLILGDGCPAPSWANTTPCVTWEVLQATRFPFTPCDPSELREVLPTDLAYVIFTSGSTGQPKGVQITRESLTILMHSWDHLVSLNHHVTLWLSAVSFDASHTEYLWTMHAGGTLVIAPSEGFTSVGKLIRTHGVTHLQCTPTRASMLLADPEDFSAIGELEHLILGGESLTLALASQLFEANVRRLTNVYGPTECTVWATSFDVTPEWVASSDKSVTPIGFPIQGTAINIVDESGAILPPGSIGEIRIEGSLVGSGYRNDHSRTSAVFTDDPAQYRTGDLGQILSDGAIEFHGRQDHQVKIRGHRIELGEIESAVMAHPRVRLAIVELDRRHTEVGTASHDLIAVVVPQFADATPTTTTPTTETSTEASLARIEVPELVAELRSHLSSNLPAIMVPRTILISQTLPLTSSGKIDRVTVRKLLGEARATVPSQIVSKSLMTLEDLALEFHQVLGRRSGSEVNADGNFFDLGGHSLLAVELMSRLKAKTGVSLPLSSLLASPTPRLLHRTLIQGSRPLYNPLVALAPLTGDTEDVLRPVLYFVHGAGGHVLRFRQMAEALRNRVEVIGIQAIGLDDDQAPDSTLAAMVDRYVEAIAAATDRRIHVGGYSDGGLIALHIADRLLRSGHDVRSVSLCDTFSPLPLPVGARAKLSAVSHNLMHRDGLSIGKWIAGSWEGWRRRREWDVEGAAALTRLGFNDLFEAISGKVREAALPPSVPLPALVIRAYVENPIRRRDYSDAYLSSGSVTTRWVPVKHDELFTDERSSEIADHIGTFINMYS